MEREESLPLGIFLEHDTFLLPFDDGDPARKFPADPRLGFEFLFANAISELKIFKLVIKVPTSFA